MHRKVVAVVPDKFLQSPFLAPGPISPVAISGVLPALPPSELAKLSQSQTFKGQQLTHPRLSASARELARRRCSAHPPSGK